jgi:phage gp46-like protein
VDEDFEQDQDWIALSQLPPVFDAYWAQTMGRTGHFPAGEHDWEGFDLQFNCAVDDEGNEVADDDLPEGEEGETEAGEVMVNTSANALAMRADLAWALSLDLATPDDATRTAVQDLQAQAATLLQVPQLGIGVWTLQREGRRQALYYVSDEQLAKQALAPLLAREEAASLEMKVDFDPAWSGYFEYASYVL